MKGTCTLVASVLAASTVALSSSSSSSSSSPSSSSGDRDIAFNPCSGEGFPSSSAKNETPCSRNSAEKEKFASRFDGLRFIETLVTAHR